MIKKLSSRIVYENKWMKVREDATEFENGEQGIYGVVEKPDFALIIPREDDHFYLVHQHRYPIDEYVWEFPQGSYEADPAITPTDLATQELQEETGLVAKKIIHIGYLYTAYGFSDQGFHIFLAEDLEQGKQQLEAAEAGLEVGKFSVAELEQMIQSGTISDASTVAAYGVLKMRDQDGADAKTTPA